MFRLFTILTLFGLGNIQAQATYEILEATDSTYQLKTNISDDDGSETVQTTEQLDSNAIVSHILTTTYRKNREVARAKLKIALAEREQKRLANLVKTVSDTTYFKFTKNVFLPRIVGVYKVRNGEDRFLLEITAKGKVKTVDGVKTEVGKVVIYSDLEFEIQNYFPEALRFIRYGEGIYVAYDTLGNRVILRQKIR